MAEIFDIGHETGDLSEYDATVTDGGDLSVENAAALCGSWGMQCVIDDTNVIYGEVDFTQITSTEYRYRIYIDPNNLSMGSGDAFDVCRILKDANNRSVIRLGYDGSDYQVRATVIDDSLGVGLTSWITITDAPHYVEVLVEYASGELAEDGAITIWVDGVEEDDAVDLDIYDISKPNRGRLGAVAGLDAGTSGTLFLDEFVFRDDDTEIGACPAAGANVPEKMDFFINRRRRIN